MGTNFMHSQKAYRPPAIRGENSVGNKASFTGRAAGGASQKNLAVAQAMSRYMKMKPATKTAASNAPGPRKV